MPSKAVDSPSLETDKTQSDRPEQPMLNLMLGML